MKSERQKSRQKENETRNSLNTCEYTVFRGADSQRASPLKWDLAAGIPFPGPPISIGNSRSQLAAATFQTLYDRVRAAARLYVSQGNVSESGLARLLHLSQPHLHNILKGRRFLTSEIADRLLRQLDMTVEDLIRDPTVQPEQSPVFFLDGFLGPEYDFPSEPHPHLRLLLPSNALTAFRSPYFVEIRGNVPRTFLEGDILMVDMAAQTRLTPSPGDWFAVRWNGQVNLRRIFPRADSFLMTEGAMPRHAAKCVEVANRSMLEVLLARVICLVRKLEPATDIQRTVEKAGPKH